MKPSPSQDPAFMPSTWVGHGAKDSGVRFACKVNGHRVAERFGQVIQLQRLIPQPDHQSAVDAVPEMRHQVVIGHRQWSVGHEAHPIKPKNSLHQCRLNGLQICAWHIPGQARRQGMHHIQMVHFFKEIATEKSSDVAESRCSHWFIDYFGRHHRSVEHRFTRNSPFNAQ